MSKQPRLFKSTAKRYQAAADKCWKLHKEQGYITKKQITASFGHSQFYPQTMATAAKYGIEFPPPLDRVTANRRMKCDALNAKYAEIKRPLTLAEFRKATKNTVTNRDSIRQWIQRRKVEGYEVPPVEGINLVPFVSVAEQNAKLDAKRWQTKGEVIKATRIGGLFLGTPVRNEGDQTWYGLI